MLDVIITLTADSKHLEAMMDADEEIKGSRKAALTTLQSLKNVSSPFWDQEFSLIGSGDG
jgi:hypothetical protein